MEIAKLVDLLNTATKAYDEGSPVMSDKEWDDYYFQLQKLEQESGIILPNSPTQKINYDVVNSLTKVKHNHPMLSLSKSKDWNDILAFLSNKNKTIIVMSKMDGLTLSLKYGGGYLISAETRGNGEVGEDVTHNAFVVRNIPKRINYTDELIVDGEIICTYTDFKKFADEYKNPRNFASGSIRLLDSKECSKRDLTFVAWEVVKGLDNNSFNTRLNQLQELGFTIVPKHELAPKDDLEKYFKSFSDYPIDGLVARYDDVAYSESLGATAHHRKCAMAYKFYDESYETYLKDILYEPSRNGILTPVALFEPIEINDNTVEKASLHNISIMHQLLGENPYEGQIINVFCANMIIPQIISSINQEHDLEKEIKPLEICPICGGSTEIIKHNGVEELTCANPNCNGKLINRIDYFVSKKGLDIKGLSKATIQKLIDWGWINCFADIFLLQEHRAEWIKQIGFGPKSVDNILAAINKSRECTLDAFIAAIGIPQIGRNTAKKLCEYLENYDDFRTKVNDKWDFSSIPGFGEVMTACIINFDFTEADKVYNFLNIKMLEVESEPKDSGSFEGLTFVITGKLKQYKNRSELKQFIESHGGKVSESISKKTSYLINNDSNSESAKNKKAKELGIPIIPEDALIKVLI